MEGHEAPLPPWLKLRRSAPARRGRPGRRCGRDGTHTGTHHGADRPGNDGPRGRTDGSAGRLLRGCATGCSEAESSQNENLLHCFLRRLEQRQEELPERRFCSVVRKCDRLNVDGAATRRTGAVSGNGAPISTRSAYNIHASAARLRAGGRSVTKPRGAPTPLRSSLIKGLPPRQCPPSPDGRRLVRWASCA